MNTKQCKGCDYWRAANGEQSSFRFCHFMLDTGERRKYVGDTCLSRTCKRKKKFEPFDVPLEQRGM